MWCLACVVGWSSLDSLCGVLLVWLVGLPSTLCGVLLVWLVGLPSTLCGVLLVWLVGLPSTLCGVLLVWLVGLPSTLCGVLLVCINWLECVVYCHENLGSHQLEISHSFMNVMAANLIVLCELTGTSSV